MLFTWVNLWISFSQVLAATPYDAEASNFLFLTTSIKSFLESICNNDIRLYLQHIHVNGIIILYAVFGKGVSIYTISEASTLLLSIFVHLF